MEYSHWGMTKMLEGLNALFAAVAGFLWGLPLSGSVVAVGIVVTVISGLIVYRRFGFILKNTFGKMFDKSVADEGGITPFQAVSTALAATVGTGNIVGVTTAIINGGPGAIFWMWLAAILGMTTKFAEVTLAVAYRERNELGEFSGGPMYYIKNGLGQGWMAKIFALFAAFAAFGIGSMVQSNSIAGAVQNQFNIPPWLTGAVIVVGAGFILIGGIKRIGQVAEKLVPFMAAFYIMGAIIILIINAGHLPGAFGAIFTNAFTGRAAFGGFAGATLSQAIRFGIARGVFTNEAGLGSAPIAHAAATTDHPARQGMWGAFEVFVDTILVCSMTALVIISSEMWHNSDLRGAALTTAAFNEGIPLIGGYIVTLGLVLFAFTTIIGWCYYGEKSAEYLFNTAKVIVPYRIVFIGLAFLGALQEIDLVWNVADTLNALMALPNLIAVLVLAPVVSKLAKQFFSDPERIYTPGDYQKIIRRR